ncbi:MAG: hypothetical protein ACRDPA_28130, partial [Solirubrobacteraceae bacterium]
AAAPERFARGGGSLCASQLGEFGCPTVAAGGIAFASSRPYGSEKDSVAAWLFTITRHVVTGSLRRGQTDAGRPPAGRDR